MFTSVAAMQINAIDSTDSMLSFIVLTLALSLSLLSLSSSLSPLSLSLSLSLSSPSLSLSLLSSSPLSSLSLLSSRLSLSLSLYSNMATWWQHPLAELKCCPGCPRTLLPLHYKRTCFWKDLFIFGL